MVLTAEQNLRIALLYEKAAADLLGVPPQQRIAFARKAKWFRMKARIRAKKEAVSAPADQHINGAPEEARLEEVCLEEAWREQTRGSGTVPRANGSHANGARSNKTNGNGASANGARPKRYLSIAERIAAARAAQS